jgi:hypothetical protein
MDPLGIYNRWDDMPFTEQTAEDLMWFFKVNVVVSYGCFLRGLYQAGSQYCQEAPLSFEDCRRRLKLTSYYSPLFRIDLSLERRLIAVS